MDIILRGQAATLTAQFLNGESPQTPDATPTVRVVNDAGDVVASGPATGTGAGPFTFDLDATATGILDVLTAVWSATFSSVASTLVTYAEIVGGFYFGLEELRALPTMGDTDRYSTAQLEIGRRWITQLINRECKTSFVEVCKRDRGPVTEFIHDGRYYGRPGGSIIRTTDAYPVTIRSLVLDGIALTDDQLADLAAYHSRAMIASISGKNSLNGQFDLDLRYTAGYSQTCPDDLHDESLIAARQHVINLFGSSNVSPTALSSTTDGTTTRYAAASRNFPTGIPSVDAAIAAWREEVRWPAI